MCAGSPDRVERRLATIIATDVVGYSRLMVDEAGTTRVLREHRAAADPLLFLISARVGAAGLPR